MSCLLSRDFCRISNGIGSSLKISSFFCEDAQACFHQKGTISMSTEKLTTLAVFSFLFFVQPSLADQNEDAEDLCSGVSYSQVGGYCTHFSREPQGCLQDVADTFGAVNLSYENPATSDVVNNVASDLGIDGSEAHCLVCNASAHGGSGTGCGGVH